MEGFKMNKAYSYVVVLFLMSFKSYAGLTCVDYLDGRPTLSTDIKTPKYYDRIFNDPLPKSPKFTFELPKIPKPNYELPKIPKPNYELPKIPKPNYELPKIPKPNYELPPQKLKSIIDNPIPEPKYLIDNPKFKLPKPDYSDPSPFFVKPDLGPKVVDPYTKPTLNPDKNLFQYLKFENNNQTNIINNMLLKMITYLQTSSNIQPSSLPRNPGTPLAGGLDHYFVLDIAEQQIKALSVLSGQILASSSIKDFFSRFELDASFFPFVFDINNPTILIFGAGEGTTLATGQAYPSTLIRNGGHNQLAESYRGSNTPDLNGLFGGGIVFKDGQVVFEFKSRSVNRGAAYGELSDDQEQVLRVLMNGFFDALQEISIATDKN
jgi:hypothetical protein